MATNTLTDFPVKHIEKNLAWGKNGSVWAYFKVEGFPYEHRDHLQRIAPFQAQMHFLTKTRGDLHFLVLPFRLDGLDVIRKTTENIETKDYPLKAYGIHHQKELERVVAEKRINGNATQYHQYIGVQLIPSKNRYKESNPGAQMVGAAKAFMEGVNGPVRNAFGLDPFTISQTEIDAYRGQAALIQQDVAAGFGGKAEPLTTSEMVAAVEYGLTLTVDNEAPQDIHLGERIEGPDGQQGVRMDQSFFYDLQNAEVLLKDHDTTPHNMKLRKSVNGHIHEQHVQYMVVSKMEPSNDHPGFEWLYNLQNQLLFPIGVSVRAYRKPNERIKKELANVRLEFKEQHSQASQAKDRLEQATEEKESDVRHRESRFQQNGHPAFSCSFTIRVTGKDPQELAHRVGEVQRKLELYNIKTQSPYGDSLKYFTEFIPTADRMTSDYWMEAEPGVLAGMLFGASVNIGDNEGMLIGFTKQQKKPVFIQPDLAAQERKDVNPLFNALSAMVMGETGKGKSVMMNHFSIMSALTNGSQVLIIDPKGDRRRWRKGIDPFVPKEMIDIWTLGENETDAGALDPFRTAADLQDGKNVALDILSYLTDAKLGSIKHSLLSETVEEAGKHSDPCLGVVVEILEKLYTDPPKEYSAKKLEALENALNSLQSISHNQLARLLFGQVGQEYRALNVNKQIQVVMVQNLLLPQDGEPAERAAEKISEAILISLTAFTKRFIFQTDRSRHKVILQDEAKTIEHSKVGRTLMDWIQRNGRYYNTTLLKGTQSASDFKSNAHIGMKFVFMQATEADAEMALSYLNLPVTPSNKQIVMNLGKGECLFQDIFGRTAVIYINVIFGQFKDAYNTSTNNEEEEKMEVGV